MKEAIFSQLTRKQHQQLNNNEEKNGKKYRKREVERKQIEEDKPRNEPYEIYKRGRKNRTIKRSDNHNVSNNIVSFVKANICLD